ncbi:MAG: class I SAM-dependent methyltransferase [Planctomycetota bacterium]
MSNLNDLSEQSSPIDLASLDDLAAYYEREDRVLALSLATLRQMKGDRVEPIASEILGFVAKSGVRDAGRRYSERNQQLQELQRDFDKSGRYPAQRYADIPAYDRDAYDLGLLLSSILTVHRFEILERLLAFLRMPCDGPSSILAVGYGTGYELRWVRELLPDWELDAFETEPRAQENARRLLRHFGFSTDGLRNAEFPLTNDTGLDQYESRYGKAVLCELLEHLEDPAHALRNLCRVLHPQGRGFVTMAINLAQEDHVHLYRGPDDARRQIREAGLRVVEELLAPVSVFPFEDAQRAEVFRRGNYVAVVERSG